MPHPNRVTPFGAFEATLARGTLMGNRGILHDAEGRFGRARWRHPHWICCRLAFRGRHRAILQPGRWTELFFLDEATAFAAGHRPCAECRREDYRRFLAAWRAAGLPGQRAAEIDRILHAARLAGGRQARTPATLESLPDGSCFAAGATAWVVRGAEVLRWTQFGYDRAEPRGRGEVALLTPPPFVALFRAGYAPALHESATAPGRDLRDRAPGKGS